jgi:hypothetical protein
VNLIGIAGRAGAGKDEAAKTLVAEYSFVRVALADSIKRICKEVFNFSDEQLWGPSEKRNEADERYPHAFAGSRDKPREWLTPRHALQTLGTEWGRACYENVWINYAIRVADTILSNEDFGYDPIVGVVVGHNQNIRGIIIPDVRFPNEVAAIRAAGGRIWKIERLAKSKSVYRREALQKGEPMPDLETWRRHESEAHVDSIEADTTILNGGTLENLADAVRYLMSAPDTKRVEVYR